ncbi:MAG: hypothetical protein EXX96DRAFT_580874, partial [Benjaminiella poitrasii]
MARAVFLKARKNAIIVFVFFIVHNPVQEGITRQMASEKTQHEYLAFIVFCCHLFFFITRTLSIWYRLVDGRHFFYCF